MTQVWLVLLGAVLLWQGESWAKTSQKYAVAEPIALVLGLLGYGCLAISVVLFFVNGGTTG